MVKKIYLLLAICVMVCAALLSAHGRRPSGIIALRPRTTATGAHVSSLARALRPNYPYSVIPGGVYTPAELRAALSHDPLLRRHFSSFNLSRLHLVKLTEDHYAYVSFRRDGRILWTRRKLKIAQGEILLTDGVFYAKTRCGNRLDELPAAPHETAELADAVLSPPPLDYPQMAGLEFVQAPVEETAGDAPRKVFTPDGVAAPAPLETAFSNFAPGVGAALPEMLPGAVPEGIRGDSPQDILSSPGFSPGSGPSSVSGGSVPGNDWGGAVAAAAAHPSLRKADLVAPIAPIPEPSAAFVLTALLCWSVLCRIRRKPDPIR